MISITYNKKVLLAQEHTLRLFFIGYTVAKPWGSETTAAPINISQVCQGAPLTLLSSPSFMLRQNQALSKITSVLVLSSSH